MFISML
jgi:hypothetical protein